MSEQQGGILELPTSFNFARNTTIQYRNKGIDPANFSQWHRDNMYKSSYAHFHSKDSIEPKNTAIPGYRGYIPYVKPENIHAKGYTPIAKQSFSQDKLARNIIGLATTGFNLNRDALIDHSKFGSTSKYGRSAIQRAHPSWNEGVLRSTTQQFFTHPKEKLDPTFRQTDKWLQTGKADTRGSGFATNHAYLDGTGWKPNPVLRGDYHRTQYRDRLNAKIPFHRDTSVSKERKLPHKQMNYKYN